MILITHALTGAVIGKYVNNVPLIIALSLIIHFAMDHLRHGEYVEVRGRNTGLKKSGPKIALDIIVALGILFSVIYFKKTDYLETRNILIGSFSSMFPDLITFFYWLLRWPILEKYYAFHSWVHKYKPATPERQWTLRNARNDIVISILAIIILFLF